METITSLPIEKLDAMLAEHPFGNADYVTTQMQASYQRRLAKIATRVPVAGQLLEELGQANAYCRYRAFGDTVLRCAVQHAHVQVETGGRYGLSQDRCAEIFRESVRLVTAGSDGLLGALLENRLGAEPRLPWVWATEYPRDNVFGSALRSIVEEHYGQSLCTPTPIELTMLSEAGALLGELLPQFSRSVLSHAHLIAVFPTVGPWERTLSSSEFRISGTVFLNRTVLGNPWTAAEHLFHEVLHQQLYDLRAAHTLLAREFLRSDAPKVHSLWNMPDADRGNYWDIHRALAAFHVYVHLSLLTTIAEQRLAEPGNSLAKRYGPLRMIGRRTALARAHYLGEQIRTTCWSELGPAGQRVVEWLSSVLDLVDPIPPEAGSYVHLLLDRYWREAQSVESLAANGARHESLADLLSGLLDAEVSTVRSVLAAVDGEVNRFDETLRSRPTNDPLMRFVWTRIVIAETLLKSCRSDYKLALSQVPDGMVRDMVETSSEKLRVLLGR